MSYAATLDAVAGELRAAVAGEARNPAGTARLKEYWAFGEGAQLIRWGVDGDFARCQANLRRVGVPGHMIDGECSNLHQLATGARPGHAPGESRAHH